MSGSRFGNAAPGLAVLADQLRQRPGSVVHVEVRHDEECAHWRGRPCNCQPEIVGKALAGGRR